LAHGNFQWQDISCHFYFGLGVMFKAILALVLAAMFTAAAEAKPVWITQDFQDGKCKDFDIRDVDASEDFIFRQCQSFPRASTWIRYEEGVRLYVGFGRKPNIAFSGADADRGDWPLVWGGERRGGKFAPTVVIGRFAVHGEEPRVNRLIVFRLLDNGLSCVVAEVDPSPEQNEKAKSLAAAAMKKWTCLNESQPSKY
jgi:hypothetical protein